MWKRRHKMFNERLARLEELAADPNMRCPKCGGMASIPKDVGINCPGCSMRYSPVTPKSARVGPIRQKHFEGFSSRECVL